MNDMRGLPDSITRRSVGIVAAVAAIAALVWSRHSFTDPGDVDPVRPPVPDPDFLRISQLLTGHADLDPMIAARLSAAFAQIAPTQFAEFRRLAGVIEPDMAPHAALAAAARANLQLTALTIVAAWYTGTAGSGSKAMTVSYLEALMYRPVADALPAPTYAMGGPGWWTAAPPDVGLARAVEHQLAPAGAGDPGAIRP